VAFKKNESELSTETGGGGGRELQVNPLHRPHQSREPVRSLGQFLKGTLCRSKTIVQQGALSRVLDEKTLSRRSEAAETSDSSGSALKPNEPELLPTNFPSSSSSVLSNNGSRQLEASADQERTESVIEKRRYKWLSYLQPSAWRSTPAPYNNSPSDFSSFDEKQRNSLQN